MTMRFFYIIAWLAIASAMAIILLVTFWLLYPYHIIDYKDKIFPISKSIVSAGSTISYEINYCKYLNLPVEVTREFRNDIIYVTPTTINNRPMGCHKIEISVLIPKELPPGQYILRQHYTWRPNPLRTIDVIKDTQQFTVTL